MNFFKKIELSIIISVVISILFSIVSFAKVSEDIRKNVLRLHILANSDSTEDQRLKIKVRDALLASGADIFDGTVDVNNALKKITPEIPMLTNLAENVIKENDFDYKVNITIKREFFNTRSYNDITLPAGEYIALRVIIGKGEGHNWWCVMFPAMCIPTVNSNNKIENVFNNDEIKLVKHNPEFDPRFKIVEIYERINNKES